MPRTKKNSQLCRGAWYVGTCHQHLARKFTTLPLPSLPASTEPQNHPKVRAQGLLRSFLSLNTAEPEYDSGRVCDFLNSQESARAFLSHCFLKHPTLRLFSQAPCFIYCLLQRVFIALGGKDGTFACKCFLTRSPCPHVVLAQIRVPVR